jgi:hypothetical protein
MLTHVSRLEKKTARRMARATSMLEDMRSGPWILDVPKALAEITAALADADNGELTVKGLAVRVRAALRREVRPEALPDLAAALRAEGWKPARRVVKERG